MFYKCLSNLLTNARTFKLKVLRLQSFFFKFEDVPLAAIESHRLSSITSLHAKKLANQVRWKTVLLEILFRRKSNVATSWDTIRIFALGSCHGREVRTAFEL